MYYLFRTNGSIKLLDGELINGMICKKSGSFLNRKWAPILAEPVLHELGLLDEANTLLKSGDTFALLTNPRTAVCVYRPGTNVEGTVIGDDKLPELLGAWLRETGMGAEIEKNLPQVLPKTKSYIFKSRLGIWAKWARQYLIEAGPELTREQFHEAMIRALSKAHVKT